MQSLPVARRHALNHTFDAAHHAVDTLADQALTGVGKVSDTVHVAVNRTADVVGNAAGWAAAVPVRVRTRKAALAQQLFAAMKARPFAILGGAVLLGIVIGRARVPLVGRAVRRWPGPK